MSGKLFWEIVLLIIIFSLVMTGTKIGVKYLMYGGKCPMSMQQDAK